MHGIGKYSWGVVFRNRRIKTFITIKYNNFTDNENGALAIINSQSSNIYVNISQTVFCNNSQALGLTLSEKIQLVNANS